MPKTAAPSTSSPTSAPPHKLLFGDLDNELKTTRRMLERVPNGKGDWRPHAKSKSLDELANHVAQLPGFGIDMLTRDELDASSRPPQPKPANTDERLEMFDEVAAELQRLVKELDWDRAMAVWTLMFRGNVAMQAPRAMMIRSAMISHLVHHRAQLGSYLRMLDVPLPSSYGPTADEQPGFR